MQILAFGVGREEQKRLESVQREITNLSVVSEWVAIRNPAAVQVIAARRLDHNHTLEQLNRLREHDRVVPIVLFTDLDEANLLNLARIVIDGVGGFDRPAEHWQAVIDAVAGKEDRRSFIERARTSTDLSDYLRIALMRLARADPPFRTVRALADSLGCSESTLRLHFKRIQPNWRLEDLIDWFVLLHYGWSQLPAKSTSAPAPRTLDRLALRLLGKPRSSLSKPGITDHPLLEFLSTRPGDQ